MARHRSPSGRHPRSQHPTPTVRPVRRRHAAPPLPSPALRGAAVVGAVLTGAVVMSQSVSLVSANADPAAAAQGTQAATLAPPVAERPAAAVTPAIELATPAVAPEPEREVQALAKGAAMAEERARPPAAEPPPAPEAETVPVEDPVTEVVEEAVGGGENCATSGFGGVADHVAQAGHHLQERFDVEDVGGVASRPGNPTSDHPRGYALDFMVDNETGDALAAYAEEHSEELGIKYVMWQVANHYDHVHISFNNQPGSGLPC